MESGLGAHLVRVRVSVRVKVRVRVRVRVRARTDDTRAPHVRTEPSP